MTHNIEACENEVVATADNGYVIARDKVSMAENISSGSTSDVFASDLLLLAGNRVSIIVDGVYINTKIEEASIISLAPFRYNTSGITGGAVPSEVFFTGDLRVEVTDIVMDAEFVNISYLSSPDVLSVKGSLTTGDELLIVKNDDSINRITIGDVDDAHSTICIAGTETKLELQGAVEATELDTTEYYTDPTFGIGWGCSADGWQLRYIYIDVSNYDYIEITYSGKYNDPVGGVGELYIANGDTGENLISFADAWATPSEGQSLAVMGETILNKSTVDVINRKDTIPVNGVNTIKIGMAGYSGRPYSKRYIKSLVMYGTSSASTAEITGGETPSRVYNVTLPLSINGLEAKDKKVKYSLTEDKSNVVANIEKRSIVLIADSLEARVDFPFAGDKMKKLEYSAGILLNDRILGADFTAEREESISISQSIIFTME